MVDFLIALIELFRYLLQFWSYEVKCVQVGCFRRGSSSLYLNFTRTGSSPSTIVGIRKLEILCYPIVKTASFSIHTIPECDGQMNGWIWRCHTVITMFRYCRHLSRFYPSASCST